jgi:ubiquinol-cytochrome c reductase cytochrome b subunit
MMRVLRAVAGWLDERLELRRSLRPLIDHPVPGESASWWNVFGSAALTLFALQVVTGIGLALVYVPSAAHAYETLEYLTYRQYLGWFLRALHFWGSNFMVAVVALHLVQVFLFGAFKYPRELTWVVGVFLLLCTLGMAFSGQILRWDQDAYWGLGIGAAVTGRVPWIGPRLVHLLLGGPVVGGHTLTRFFALHVFAIPGLLAALAGVHVLLVLRCGISEPPVPGRRVDRAAYRQRYEELLRREGVPFFPVAARKDLVFSALVILAVVACAALIGPYGPGGPPDPTLIHTQPRPDFFFLWLFAALALLPPGMETALILTAPAVVILLLLAVPFLSGTGERSPRRRPVAVLVVLLTALTLGVLTDLGRRAPWSPAMAAWSGTPVPVRYVEDRSPLELQGALVLQNKQCRNCHRLGGGGGERGPALDGVATRMTREQLIRQVLQGGGNMPAYGKHLTPSEVTALVAFLGTLHPAGQPPLGLPPEPGR